MTSDYIAVAVDFLSYNDKGHEQSLGMVDMAL